MPKLKGYYEDKGGEKTQVCCSELRGREIKLYNLSSLSLSTLPLLEILS